jgi:hypothetical protein
VSGEMRSNERGLRILAWLIVLVNLVLIAAGGFLYYWNRVIPLVGRDGFSEVFTGTILALGYGIVGLLILNSGQGMESVGYSWE